MLNYYKHLLGSHTKHRKRIDHAVIAQGPALSMEQQICVCKDFSDREIKEVIFSIPNTKSPGLDGFSSGFFKSSWKLIGLIICATVKHFFKIGDLPSKVSNIKLVVLPKTPHLQTASEFRSILCCNVIYKCISKLLCQRIKEVLSSIISPMFNAKL